MSALAHKLTQIAWHAVGGAESPPVDFDSAGGLTSAFPVTDFASASVATAGLAIAELIGSAGGSAPSATIDRRLASFWFYASIRPLGWALPPVWDPIAGDYETQDGWIRLHTNAPHHRAAAQSVLGPHDDKDAMARAVRTWRGEDLEAAIVAAGGCAAQMRATEEWRQHAQGAAVANEPLVHLAWSSATAKDWTPDRARPLEGLRVLDLTRILAGPVASRFLAGFGADVLRIDPIEWDEPVAAPEVTLGKSCARLDLHDANDRAIFESLLTEADIVLHGYRPDALERLGLGAARRREIAPDLIDVSLCAYGWSGPWALRRGFDSLVQMSSGIAHTGMEWRKAQKPFPLPVQALDHATGYLVAAAAIRGVTERHMSGRALQARLSLARTAQFLFEQELGHTEPPLANETLADRDQKIETTDWGEAQRIKPPLVIEGAPVYWSKPARKLGSSEAKWAK
jgi:crotonobetainyl-CoA:carnitine CoA-transferase CaiB-like acyl-CoA transferase